jgi:hypothetical protein
MNAKTNFQIEIHLYFESAGKTACVVIVIASASEQTAE